MKRVKCTLVQALRLCTGRTAYRGSRGIALPFHDHGTRRGWGVSVTSRPLFTPGKDPVPIVRQAGWAPGPVWTGAEDLAPTGIRSLDRPAHSWVAVPTELPGPHWVWDLIQNELHMNHHVAVTVHYVHSVQYNLKFVRKFAVSLVESYALRVYLTWHLCMSYHMSDKQTTGGSGKVKWRFWFWRWWKSWCRQSTKHAFVQDFGYWIVITMNYKMQSVSVLSMTTLHLNRSGNENLIFVVPSIMLYSSEISPTRCNNCVFILRNGFTLHVSGDNLTHHQEYIRCIWPQVSRLT